jgi:hypothetical protein
VACWMSFSCSRIDADISLITLCGGAGVRRTGVSVQSLSGIERCMGGRTKSRCSSHWCEFAVFFGGRKMHGG